MRFFDVLVGYEIALWNAVDGELSARGAVRLGHLHALRVLDRYDGRARVQEVSADIGITVGAASKLVDRLERDGLAERQPNPANRRSSLVLLTTEGQRSLADGLAVAHAALDRAVGERQVDSYECCAGDGLPLPTCRTCPLPPSPSRSKDDPGGCPQDAPHRDN